MSPPAGRRAEPYVRLRDLDRDLAARVDGAAVRHGPGGKKNVTMTS